MRRNEREEMGDMKEKEILRHVDHTLLSQSAVWDEIRQVCDDAIKYGTASVCIPPSYVKQASEYVGGKIPICTVIGFPNGYETTAVKEFEIKDAIANGADEIDMVINIGWLKDRKYDQVEDEIRVLKNACGSKVLKVIIETCLLTDEEKVKMCEIVTRSGADYIKTSTGFSKAGATFEDISLFADHIGGGVKMKAAGGISSMEDAEKFLALGADRLGTSRIVKIVKTSEGSDSANGSNMSEKSGAEGTSEIELSQEMIGKLIETANAQLTYSYSPYSGFKVGAALLAENGRIYTGCNIENAAFSPTNCAERTAFFKAVSEGERRFRAICIVGGKDCITDEAGGENNISETECTPPCGVCRQVMAEFCNPQQFQVILASGRETYKIFRLEELLPLGFGAECL